MHATPLYLTTLLHSTLLHSTLRDYFTPFHSTLCHSICVLNSNPLVSDQRSVSTLPLAALPQPTHHQTPPQYPTPFPNTTPSHDPLAELRDWGGGIPGLAGTTKAAPGDPSDRTGTRTGTMAQVSQGQKKGGRRHGCMQTAAIAARAGSTTGRRRGFTDVRRGKAFSTVVAITRQDGPAWVGPTSTHALLDPSALGSRL